MADTAFQTQYRQEFINVFETTKSLLSECVTKEAVIKGNTAVFDVAGSNGATAVTRGINGDIPALQGSQTQVSVTLKEFHAPYEKTGFNIFASQGDQRMLMMRNSSTVINRKLDSQIITELATATNDTGAATTASLNLAVYARTILGNNKVPNDGGIHAAITPAFLGYLMKTTEFANAQYVRTMPMQDGQPFFTDSPGYYEWMGIKWIEHPDLPGAGTSAEKCFMWHRSAIGYAMDTRGIQTDVGYDGRHDKSWARATVFGEAKLLQNSGVALINHNGSAYAAQ